MIEQDSFHNIVQTPPHMSFQESAFLFSYKYSPQRFILLMCAFTFFSLFLIFITDMNAFTVLTGTISCTNAEDKDCLQILHPEATFRWNINWIMAFSF